MYGSIYRKCSTETESVVAMGWGRGGREGTARDSVSFGGDENVLKSTLVMPARLCEDSYTSNRCTVHALVVRELPPDKAVGERSLPCNPSNERSWRQAAPAFLCLLAGGLCPLRMVITAALSSLRFLLMPKPVFNDSLSPAPHGPFTR